MDHLDNTNASALLLNADFEKAFDSLEWQFIEYCVMKFNFGPSITKWLKLFYADITTRISNNGWATEKFTPTRGCRQACPLSPYLFILCADILAVLLKNNNRIQGLQFEGQNFLISQYADDTIILIEYCEETLREVINTLNIFSRYSGLKINYDKCQILPLGRIKHVFDRIPPECKIEWTQGPIRSLGIEICHRTEDLIKLNYTKTLKKMENILQMWGKRYLTLYGKVTILNSFVISQLVYQMSVLPSPTPEMIAQINTMIFNFIWNNKPDKIKRKIMKQSKCFGGLSVPDVVNKNQALKIAWIPRLLHPETKAWMIFLTKYIPMDIKIFLQCNMNTEDITSFINKFQTYL